MEAILAMLVGGCYSSQAVKITIAKALLHPTYAVPNEADSKHPSTDVIYKEA